MIPALLILLQDPLAQKVAFEAPAMPLRKAVAQLSDQTKVKLKATDAMLNTPVFIKSKDLSLKEIMDALAEVGFGEWVLEDGTYLLKPSKAAELKARNADAAVRQPMIQKILDQFKESLATELDEAVVKKEKERARAEFKKYNPELPDPDDRQLMWSMRGTDPSQRFGLRMLQAIGAQRLSRCGFGDRIVFSSNPTIKQEQLPRAASLSAFQAFEREAKFMGQQGAVPVNIPLAIGPDQRPHKAGPATEIHIIVSSDLDTGNIITARLESFDAQGYPVAPWARIDGLRLPDQNNFQPPADPSAYFAYTPEAVDFNLFLRRSMDSGARVGKVEKPERFLKPLERDPLALSASELASRWADAEGGQAVFAMPDLMAFLASMTSDDGKRGSVAMAKTFMDQFPFLREGKVGRVKTVCASTPAMGEMFTSDRARMEEYLDSVLKRGSVDPEEEALYLAQGDQLSMIELGRLMAAAYVGKPGMENFQDMDSPLLRMYGRLTPVQRQKLRTGEALSLTQLSPRALAPLLKALYTCHPRTFTSPFTPGATTLAQQSPYGGTGTQMIKSEPTTAFPNPPRDARITLLPNARVRWECMQDPSEPRGENIGEGLEQLGQVLAYNENPQLAQGPVQAIGAYLRITDITESHVLIDYGSGIYQGARVSQSQKSLTPKPVLFKDLPEKVRAEIEKAKAAHIERLKEWKKQRDGGGG